MKKSLFALLAAAVACGGSNGANQKGSSGPISVGAALRALPPADSLTIGTPSNPTKASVQANCMGHPPSRDPSQICTPGNMPYERMAEMLSKKVSSGITHWVTFLQNVLSQANATTPNPNVSCTTDSCTVQLPSRDSDPVAWTAVVSQTTDSSGALQYSYTLSGQLKSGGKPVTVVTATIQPGSEAGQGKGTILIDFDAESTLGLSDDRGYEHETGQLTITFDNTNGLSLTIQDVKGQDASNEPAESLTLTFQQDASGQGGSLQLTIVYGTNRQVTVNACWDGTGQGQSTVQIQGEPVMCPESSGQSATAATETTQVTECWGAASACYPLQYFNASSSSSDGSTGVNFTYPQGATPSACTMTCQAPPPSGGGSSSGGGTGGGM